AADAEDAGGSTLVAARLLQHPLDVPDLHFAQGRERPAALLASDPLGQILDADTLAASPQRRLLHDLAQLAQVLGPAVRSQRGFGLRREVARCAWAPLEEVARERADVVGALAQRGELERLGREPLVQVLAEQPGRDARAPGTVVDGTSRELAAAPWLPEEQDGRLARREAPQLGKEAPEDGILAGCVLEPGSDVAALRVLQVCLVPHG